MKSKLFNNNPVISKGFSEDIEIISNLDITAQILEILPKTISQYIFAIGSKSEVEALENLRKIWPLPPKEMEAVFNLGGFFLQKIEIEDSIDDIMSDLETLAVIESKKLPQIRPFVEALIEEYKNTFHAKSNAVSTQLSGLKVVKGITHIIDLRPVVSNRLESGDDAMSYKPKINTLVPVAILRIRLSGNDEFVFQMSGEMLKILQNELMAIDKELEETVAFVGNDKITLL